MCRRARRPILRVAALAPLGSNGYTAAVQTVIVIPARWGATRLPGKPLADLMGRPLVVHVWDRARQSARATRVLVATDDHRIARVIERAGGEAVLTPPGLASGTDRCAWVLDHLPLHAEIIVNLQGDMPLVAPADLDRLIAHLQQHPAQVATAWRPLAAGAAANPARVKVVATPAQRALYFSRSAIPAGGPFRGHVGVYAFRAAALRHFASLPSTPLQRTEDLEQLRLLEHDVAIDVVEFVHDCPSVDTPADLDALRARLAA